MPSRVAVRTVAFAIAITIGSTSCSQDPAPRAAVASSSPASSSSTTSTIAPTTTIALMGTGRPVDAVNQFVSAWRNGDRDAALTIAVPDAVDTVFGAGDPGSVQNRGCNAPPADSPVLCVYKTTPGELQVRAILTPVGWIVDQAKLTPA